MITINVAVFLIGLSVCNGLLFNRTCDSRASVPVIGNFSVAPYLGKWFEMERYEQNFQFQADCTTAEYSNNADGSVNVLNRAIHLETNTSIMANGRALVAFPNEIPMQGKLNVSFFNQPNDRANYMIVGTDYNTFAVVWSCEDFSNATSDESYWLLSRTPSLTTNITTVQMIDASKNVIGLDRARIRATLQSDALCQRGVASFHTINQMALLLVALLVVSKF